MNKLWYIQTTMLFNNKRDKLLLATTWMNLKTITYAEGKRLEVKYIFYVHTYEVLE